MVATSGWDFGGGVGVAGSGGGGCGAGGGGVAGVVWAASGEAAWIGDG